MTDRFESDATLRLLARVRAGDESALNQLIARYIPELSRWAAGRLPGWARHAVDTDDLVQETLIQVFSKLEGFEYRGEGALFAYLRQSILNRIRNQIRWADRRPEIAELDNDMLVSSLSPLEAAIGAEAVERYEAALARLTADEREALVARIELGLTYPELAQALGKPSPDAARMAVARAMVHLTEKLRDAGPAPATDRPGRERR